MKRCSTTEVEASPDRGVSLESAAGCCDSGHMSDTDVTAMAPIVKDLTIGVTIETWIDGIEFPQVDPSDPPRAIKTLGDFLLELHQQVGVGDTDLFDRGKAVLSWIQGRALSQLFPLDRSRFTGLLKRGQWGPFLTRYWRYGTSTAYWCRRIYETWPDNVQEVKRLGYTGCLGQLLHGFDVNDEHPDDSPLNSGSGDKDRGDTGHNKTQLARKPLPPLGNLIQRVQDAVAKLLEAARQLPDSYDSPERRVVLITDFKTQLTAIAQDFRRAQQLLDELELIAAEQVWRDAQARVASEQDIGELPCA